jgi:hypothetical protein
MAVRFVSGLGVEEVDVGRSDMRPQEAVILIIFGLVALSIGFILPR